MKLNLIVFLLSISYFTFGQEHSTISGSILSVSDSTDVPYAHIGRPQFGVGTISNISGKFKWNVDCTDTDTVYISHVCFETKKILLGDLQKDSIIYLTPRTITLAQIYIYPEDKLKELVGNVLKNIPENYPSKLHYMQGFYREVQYSRSTDYTTRLLEAAFNIQDKGYRSELENIRLDVANLRRSNNFSEENLFSRLMKKMFPEKANALYDAIKSDPIRSYFSDIRGDDNSILTYFKKSEDVKYTLLAEIEDNNNNFLKIGYSMESQFIGYYDGYIIVNPADYSISELYYRYCYHSKGEEITIEEYIVQYHLIGGKYYPIRIHHEHISDVRKDDDANRTNGISINTLIFTNYYTQRSEFERIKRKFDLKDKGDLYDQKFVYDSAFWNNYNILLEEPLNPKFINDLEKEQPLHEQFEKP